MSTIKIYKDDEVNNFLKGHKKSEVLKYLWQKGKFKLEKVLKRTELGLKM